MKNYCIFSSVGFCKTSFALPDTSLSANGIRMLNWLKWLASQITKQFLYAPLTLLQNYIVMCFWNINLTTCSIMAGLMTVDRAITALDQETVCMNHLWSVWSGRYPHLNQEQLFARCSQVLQIFLINPSARAQGCQHLLLIWRPCRYVCVLFYLSVDHYFNAFPQFNCCFVLPPAYQLSLLP